MPKPARKRLLNVLDVLRAKYPADFGVSDGDADLVAAEYLTFLDHAVDHYKASFAMNESAAKMAARPE